MKKIISIILILVILSTTVFAAYDVNSASNILYKMKIIIGDENGDLMLDKNFTRAEFATVITRLLALEENNNNTIKFDDVLPSFWGYKYINTCVSNGYLIGDGDGNFRPNDPIKYEEVLTIMLRILNKEHDEMLWPDDYISLSEEIEITVGTNLNKGDKITRGDSFIIICNCLDK